MTRSAAAASSAAAADAWLVACFCAEWCGACRAFRAEFDAVCTAFPQVRFAWVDIEDHPDVMGDEDVDTFPTMLITDASGRGFLGPIEPRRATLQALLAGALRGDHAPQPASARLSGMACRVEDASSARLTPPQPTPDGRAHEAVDGQGGTG